MRTRYRRMAVAGLALLVTVAAAANVVSADTVNLGTLTIDKLETNTNLPGSHFSVDVFADSTIPEEVSFRFNNIDGGGSIDAIYFYDGTILDATMGLESSTGVSFSSGASPGHLPGYEPTVEFLASAGSNANRIDAGESLTITFSLVSGKTYNTIMSDLMTQKPGAPDGRQKLELGFRVQSIDGSFLENGGSDSDSFINAPPVPLPAAAWGGLALFGALGAKGYVRRRNRGL